MSRLISRCRDNSEGDQEKSEISSYQGEHACRRGVDVKSPLQRESWSKESARRKIARSLQGAVARRKTCRGMPPHGVVNVQTGYGQILEGPLQREENTMVVGEGRLKGL